MSPADPRRGSRANLADLIRTAQDAYRERDYEQVIQLLESIPEQKLSEKLLDLLDLCRERVEEVEELKADIEDALGREKFKELREHLERLLEIKPGAKRYREMLKAMNSVRHGQYRVRLHRDGTRSIDVVGSDFSWGGVIAGVSVLAAVCLCGYFAVQWYLNRPTAQLVVRTDDPALELRVDGERWPWTGNEAARDVQSGPHEVDALRDGEVVDHRTVRSETGKRLVLTFETAGGALVVHEQQEDLAVAVAEAVPVTEGAGDSLLPWNWGSGADATAVTDSLQPVPPGGAVPVVSVVPGSWGGGVASTRVGGKVPIAASATPREGRPNLTSEPSLRIRQLAMSTDARNRMCVLSPDGRRFAALRPMPQRNVLRIYDTESLLPLVDIDFGNEPTWVSIDWARGFVVGNPRDVLVGRSYLDPNAQAITYGGGLPVSPRQRVTNHFSPDGSRIYFLTSGNPLQAIKKDGSAIESLPLTVGSPVSWDPAPGNEWFVGSSVRTSGDDLDITLEVRRFPGRDAAWRHAVTRPARGATRVVHVARPSRDGNEAVAVVSYADASAPEGRRDIVFWFHRDGRFVSHELPGFVNTPQSAWFVSDDCRRVANIDRSKSRIVVLESWSGRTLTDFSAGMEMEEIFAATPDLGRLAVHTFATSPEFNGRVFQVGIFAVDRQ